MKGPECPRMIEESGQTVVDVERKTHVVFNCSASRATCPRKAQERHRGTIDEYFFIDQVDCENSENCRLYWNQ